VSRALVAIAVASTLTCTGCGSHPDPAPPCVDGIQPGTQLTFTLDSVYDATSRFLYERYPEVPPWQPGVGCDGVDGLTVGSTVTFIPEAPLYEAGPRCAPYAARFEPEVATSAVQNAAITNTSRVEGVSVAACFTTGMLANDSVWIARELVTPAKDLHATPVDRSPPPILVSRSIQFSKAGRECGDAWVATPTSAK
jgi:hypothetical protein